MYSVLSTLSEYTYFYISKNITSYTFFPVFKIVESLQCILKAILYQTRTVFRCIVNADRVTADPENISAVAMNKALLTLTCCY